MTEAPKPTPKEQRIIDRNNAATKIKDALRAGMAAIDSHTPVDNRFAVEVIKHRLEHPDATAEQIAKEKGYSPDQVSKYLGFGQEVAEMFASVFGHSADKSGNDNNPQPEKTTLLFEKK